MTDKEIIQGLIARDNRVTEEFFFVKCRPLFYAIMKLVFSYEVDYDEMVNELYVYLMEDDAVKLKNFQYRCSVYQWLKILAIRYFIKKRKNLIEDDTHEPPYNGREEIEDADAAIQAQNDLERLFNQMPNKRYVHVIRHLIIEDVQPDELAEEMEITTANLYNIKRRAIVSLTRTALKDIKEYGK